MPIYNRKLDRWIDLRVGLAGPGMHDYLMDEVEFGARVAQQLDDPDQVFWVFHPGPYI